MPDAIQAGDVVQLKSGGSSMTVEKVNEARASDGSQALVAHCVWFQPSELTVQRDKFPLVVLEKSPSPRGDGDG